MDAPAQGATQALIFKKSQCSGQKAMPKSVNGKKFTYSQFYEALGLTLPQSTQQLATVVAQILSSLISENGTEHESKSAFNSSKMPAISLKDYLVRAARFTRCSCEALVLAVIYIDRYNEAREGHMITALNGHKCT